MNFTLPSSLLYFSLLGGLACGAHPAPKWEPKKVLVFAVSVIEPPDAKSFSFNPQKERRDVELMKWFKRSGTPADQIRHLRGSHATLSASREALSVHLRLSRPGNLLVFYYTGHGSRQSDGATYFVPRDFREDAIARTGWGVAEILDTIEEGFKGDRVLLIADCCYSGALGREAAKRPGRISWASLSSSQGSEQSTGKWTFTESLLAGLRGEPYTDLNGDGEVRFGELASFIEQEMAFADGQLSSSSVTGAFDRNFVLAKALPRRLPRFGERLLVEYGGEWCKARVMKSKGDKVYVHYPGWSSEWDEWVGPNRVRPYAPKQFPKGAKVQVEWKGKWWPATVLDGRLGIHYTHYDGHSEVWDEWVSPKRIRPRDD